MCNIGSTSFKFQLIDMTDETVLARGHIERVGSESSPAKFYRGNNDTVVEETVGVADQRVAVRRRR